MTNFPLRSAAVLLCTVVLTGTLAACRGDQNTSTTTGSTTTSATTTTMPATSGTSDATLPGQSTPGTGSSGASSTSGSDVLGSMLEGDGTDLAGATLRFNGAAYRISGTEQLRRDEVGQQLMLISNVAETLERDGDAIGLPEGTRVYAIKDNNDYSDVAVEVNGMLYRANKLAE